MSDVTTCPKCHRQVSLPREAPAESIVRCPLCGQTYTLHEAHHYLPPALEIVSSASGLSDDAVPWGASEPAADTLAAHGANWRSDADLMEELDVPHEAAHSPSASESPDDWLTPDAGLDTAGSEFDVVEGDGTFPLDAMDEPVGEADSAPAATVTAAPTKKRRRPSAVALFLQVIIGGLLGIVIVYAVLLWAFNRDPFQLAKALGDSPMNVIIPKAMRKSNKPYVPPVIAAGNGMQQPEDGNTTPPPPDDMNKTEPGKTEPETMDPLAGPRDPMTNPLPGSTDPLVMPSDTTPKTAGPLDGPIKPAPDPFGPSPDPFGPMNPVTSPPKPTPKPSVAAYRNPPSVSAQQVGDALREANDAALVYTDGPKATDDDRKRAKGQFLRKLYVVAEKLTFAWDDLPEEMRTARLSALRTVALRPGEGSDELQSLGSAAGVWIRAIDSKPPRRTAEEVGVVYVGTVQSIERKERAVLMRVSIFGPVAQDAPTEYLVISPTEMPNVKEKGLAAFVGVIVENPAEKIDGYEGTETRAIWSVASLDLLGGSAADATPSAAPFSGTRRDAYEMRMEYSDK